MRIGTWNVEYAYETRLEALRAKLAENSADIWVLTETHDAPDKPTLSDHSGMVVAVGEPAQKRVTAKTKEEIVARAADAAFGKPLVTNVQRSMLAEIIVAEALEPDWTWCAADYASCDFRHQAGARGRVH